jgi:hypothetical protein
MIGWLALVVLLSLASPTWAAFVEVGGGSQRATKQVFNVASTTLAFPASVTTNNLLVVVGSAWAGGTPGSIAVTGLQGAYTVVNCPATSDTFRSFIAWRRSTTTGSETVTVDALGTGSYISFSIDEFLVGTGQQPVLDASGACTDGTGTAVSGTIATATANALILGVVSGTGGQTITPGAGYTQIGESEPTHPHNAVFRVATTAQPYTVTWTLGGSAGWSAHAIALREAAPDTQAPTVPQGLNCTGQTTSTIACTWSASTDNVAVTDYILERSPAGCASFATISVPIVTGYTDTSLPTNTPFCYRVSARDPAQNISAPSSTAAATTLAARQATLTWTNNGAYTTVVVERCPTASCSNFTDYSSVAGNLTTYVDPNSATPASTYRVRAQVTGSADSAPSQSVTTTSVPLAVLSVAPPSLTYAATIGGSNPPAQALTISNSPGSQPMSWTVADDAAWLACAPASGTDTTVLACSVNISGLSSGTQFATITVSAPGATGTPQSVVVTLNLSPAVAPATNRGGRVR